MMNYCGECAYLGTCYDDGTFWCDLTLERVYAHQLKCYRACEANRPSSVSESYIRYSKDKSSRYYITTKICETLKMPDNNPFLNSIKFLRDGVMEKDEKYKNLLAEYDIVGPVIANSLSNDPLKYQIAATNFFKYIKPISKLVKEEKYVEAISSYKEMTDNLKTFYNIDPILESTNSATNEQKDGIYKVKKITY